MKRFFIFALSALIVISSALTVHAYSSNLLSPALSMLSEDEIMIKSALISSDIQFSKDDFEKAVGCSVDYITITALPPSSAGTLMLGDAPVSVNQTMSAASIANLRFEVNENCIETSFRFKAGAEYSIECLLRYTASVNLAPVISKSDAVSEVWTQRDIATYGTLRGSDPEGDPLTFEIVKYPEKGIVKLTNKSNGDYIYTPCDGVIGKDSFTYTVRDAWGNYSEESTVIIDIDKAICELVFADMNGHWAYNAALVMAAENAMDIESVDGELYFNPDEEITREDFLVTVMKALGSGEIEPASTIFDDDDKISEEVSGYIARAYNLGIIKGAIENGKLCFKPHEKITRAEAAVILNSIIGAKEPETIPVFADNAAVPTWAKSSMYALTEAGVFKGTGSGYISPNDVLNRAQTAQIILTVKKLYG